MTRYKAAALHSLFSLALIGLIAAVVLPLWHPWGIYRISGVLPLLAILAAVQLAAGPLLTLIIYKQGKKTLRFDLAVIGLLQLGFLGVGLYTLWQSRPVFVVASNMRMAVVLANEVSDTALQQAARPEWSQLSSGRPLLVGLQQGAADRGQQSVLSAFLNTGMDREQQPRWYLPYAEAVPQLLSNATASTADALPAAPGNPVRFRSLPIVARYGQGRILLDADTGMPLKVVTY
jgi:hypothetical protein